MNKILVSMLSHRPFKYSKPTWDILLSLSKRYKDIDINVNFQDLDFYNQVPDEYKEHINVIIHEEATNQGENRIYARTLWKEYSYISLLDDDITRFSDVIQKSGKLGYVTNVSAGRTKQEVIDTSADKYYTFIQDAIKNKLNNGFSVVTSQGRLFAEWHPEQYKDSKSTSTTQHSIWRADAIIEATKFALKHKFPRIHGDDIIYSTYTKFMGNGTSCDLRCANYPKKQGITESALRPDNTFADLSVLDFLWCYQFITPVKFRKMNTGFIKTFIGDNYDYDYLINRLTEMDISPIKTFVEYYLEDVSTLDKEQTNMKELNDIIRKKF